jgi:thiol-disulfide isomerase/thioredoxin
MKIWDESFLGMPEYRSFIDSYINIMASRRCDENSTNEEYLDALLSCIKLIPEKSIREHLLFDKIRMFLGADLVANKKHYFDHFIINNTNEKYRAEITEVYLKTLALQPGTKAPSFILLNSNNNPLTIEMLQGSCVYLIFWATWCGPCVKTFPDYKSLASEYKEIKFVYISLDSDENKWKDFSVKHDLHHLNFWLSEGLNSSMAKAYQVETLPRFVLIDKKGYVIQKNAYHPSTKEIRLLLDSLSRKNNLE